MVPTLESPIWQLRLEVPELDEGFGNNRGTPDRDTALTKDDTRNTLASGGADGERWSMC